jgi:Zn-dependent peptidase ImmA (M78 family)
MPRLEANPTLSVLVWARESAGLSVEAAARKAGVKADRLSSWESGTERPSFAQLRKLASAYKRPLAVFYLSEPPYRFQVMHDFRRLGELEETVPSPELTLEIRRAHDRREWALELLEAIEEESPNFQERLSIRDDSEEAATTVRRLLGITLERQASWRTKYEAFNGWRLLIERAGMLSFQANGVELSEARGFSIALRPLPVVVANIKDAPRARIFTLLHEVAHVLLADGGICDLHDSSNDESSRVEAYCNRVAGAALFPRAAILGSHVVQAHRKGDPAWKDEELAALSRHFGGSREAALVRLLGLGLTTERFYRESRERFLKLYAQQREKQGPGFAPPHQVALFSAGPTFTNLVIESFNRERITASDVSDYLQVRLRHLSEIQRDYAKLSA